MKSCLIHFGGSTVAVDTEGERSAEVVEYLFGLVSRDGGGSPYFRFRLVDGIVPGILLLTDDGGARLESVRVGELAERLLGQVCFRLADQARDGLLFHSAAVSWEGRGLLLPGQTGRGKTTLAAWLLGRGFRYLTDELVFVADGSDELQALTRPLNLKQTARPAMADRIEWEAHESEIWSSAFADLVPIRLLSPLPPASACPLSVMIFPHFEAGAACAFERISKAQAGLDLMQCLVNARNLAGHGFPEAARLARRVPAYRLKYGSFEQLGSRIEDACRCAAGCRSLPVSEDGCAIAGQ